MDADNVIPFLAEFFEPRMAGAPSALGTETFTKTREDNDTDAAPERRTMSASSMLLGTQTLTETREDSDVDEKRVHWRADSASYGTETGTATREDSDSDHDVRGGPAVRAEALGTGTETRAREDSDRDPVAGDALWTARVI